MDFLKDISPINKFLFFPPSPPSYCIDSYSGELCNLDGVLCLALASFNPSSHIILYCHGNASDVGKCRRYLMRLRDTLGIHVIAIEYPGYGVSDGSPCEKSVDRAVLKVYNFVHGVLKWPKTSIIMLGRSIGAGPSVRLASREVVGALILLAAFTSVKAVAEFMLGKAATVIMADRWKNIEDIKKVKCPVLFIHGSIDRTIPPTHSIELFNACTHTKRDIQIFENLDHNRYNWKLIIQKLEEFMVKFDLRDPGLVLRSLTIPRECFEEWGNHGKAPCEPPISWSPTSKTADTAQKYAAPQDVTIESIRPPEVPTREHGISDSPFVSTKTVVPQFFDEKDAKYHKRASVESPGLMPPYQPPLRTGVDLSKNYFSEVERMNSVHSSNSDPVSQDESTAKNGESSEPVVVLAYNPFPK